MAQSIPSAPIPPPPTGHLSDIFHFSFPMVGHLPKKVSQAVGGAKTTQSFGLMQIFAQLFPLSNEGWQKEERARYVKKLQSDLSYYRSYKIRSFEWLLFSCSTSWSFALSQKPHRGANSTRKLASTWGICHKFWNRKTEILDKYPAGGWAHLELIKPLQWWAEVRSAAVSVTAPSQD